MRSRVVSSTVSAAAVAAVVGFWRCAAGALHLLPAVAFR
jgi:hypothetical protein